tara:strand:- start:651 stop:1322 length:672 start_codon:yes stop_codon:yes gene_type:complete
MPTSYPHYKKHIQLYFQNEINKKSKILDVGPGMGTYSNLLRELGFNIDCIEIYAPYVTKYNLSEKYDSVHIGDIMDFDISNYDFIILGDILEHLDTDDAHSLMKLIKDQNKKCLVAVPYLMEQGTHEGNAHEAHLQPDLTPTVMKHRYPELSILIGNQFYGYYINDDTISCKEDSRVNSHNSTFSLKYFNSIKEGFEDWNESTEGEFYIDLAKKYTSQLLKQV